MKIKTDKPKMSEAELKYAVSDYLRYGTNQGRWYASRLNSGIAYVKRGDKNYAITLCEEGTADFFVIQKDIITAYPTQMTVVVPRLIFLELKSAKGKTSPAQDAFKLLVEKQGASYFLIRSIEELEAILEEN